MKKLFFTFIISLAVLSAGAQKFGVKTGLNFANGDYEFNNASLSTSNLTGFQLGVVGDFPVSQDLYFNTGLLYSTKGTTLDVGAVEVKIHVNYLELPLNMAFKHDLGGVTFFAQAGPYLAAGISAKGKSGSEEEDIEFGDGDGEYKRIDFGLNVGTGVEINAIQVGINYGLGLVDVEQDADSKLKNGVLSFTLGYFF